MKRLSIGDIRVVIGSVLGIIGLFLVFCSFIATTPADLDKSGGINANLWAGAGLLVVAVAMWLWAFFARE